MSVSVDVAEVSLLENDSTVRLTYSEYLLPITEEIALFYCSKKMST